MGAFDGNPLVKITIGGNVHISPPHFSHEPPLDTSFEEFYIANGSRAGTYVRTSATSTDWRLLKEWRRMCMLLVQGVAP